MTGGAGLIPPMTFDAATLLDPERLERGPIVVYWNQDHEEHTHRDLKFGERPRVPWRRRIRGVEPWRFTVRLLPPPDMDLWEFGKAISKRVGTPWPPDTKPDKRDVAIWLPGVVLGKTAADALGGATKVLTALGGIDVGAVQVRVDPWDAAETEKVAVA